MHLKALPLALLVSVVQALPADLGPDSWPVSAASTTPTKSDRSSPGQNPHSKSGGKACPARGHRGSQHPLSGSQDSGTGSGSWPSGGSDGTHHGSASYDDWLHRPGSPDLSAPAATLLPTVHWSQDTSDLDHIRPRGSQDQYYMPSGSSWEDDHQFGWLKTEFNDNAIMLDLSNLYTWTYSAATGSLNISFKNKNAFELAQQSWHAGLIFVFYDGSCGTAMNCYVVCKELAFDASSQTCSMSTSVANFEDVFSSFQFDWGNFKPGGKPSATQTAKPSSPTAATTTSTTASPSVLPGNYSFGFNPDDVNCAAPPDTVYGLPTACLGQYFDEDLDQTYGLIELDVAAFGTFANQFTSLFYDDPIPGALDEDDYAADDAALNLPKRLSKRVSWPNPFAVLVEVIAPVVEVFTKAYDIPIINKKISLNIPSERQTVASPWGQQVLIKSFSKESSGGSLSGKIDLYCVDCGASGSADISGSIGVSATQGISYVRAALDANLAVGLKLGLDAEAQYNQKFSQQLFIVPLSPLTIGVASIGPFLKVGAELDLNLKARGQVLAGGSFSLSNAHAEIEVTSFSGKASGWSPSFDPVFEASGEISASADFGVPLAVALGISALTYSVDVSLVERPAVVAKAQTSATANLDGAGFVEVNGCTGISAGLSFKNDVYVQINLPGTSAKRFDLHNYPEKSLISRCIALPAAPVSPRTDGLASPADDGSADHATIPKRMSAAPWVLPRQSNDSGVVIDTTSQTLANATTVTTPFFVPDSNDMSWNRTDGYYISTLVDNTGSLQAYPCSDGNIHVFGASDDNIRASDCQADFTFYQDPLVGDVAVADGFSRIFVYYPDEMNAAGVSRIRVVDTESIPSRAEEIFWILGATAPGSAVGGEIYYPLDRAGNTFYPVVCRYVQSSGLYNKLFLVKDPSSQGGVATLRQANLKYSITGGDVESCYFLPLIDGERFGEAEDNGGLFVYD